ncbi:unnamed protein product [Polarella glacialis]|uniref:Protein kinase domain-containing protein n=1 Tax=Polarella glacialis TaxID=89957 RepID=A0A813IHY4_POLGL|nr:unnamed protein product [Polarella glacialis]
MTTLREDPYDNFSKFGLCSDASCCLLPASDANAPVFQAKQMSSAIPFSQRPLLDTQARALTLKPTVQSGPMWDLQLHHLHVDPEKKNQGSNNRLLRAKLPGCCTVQEIVETTVSKFSDDSTSTGIDCVVTDNALMIVFSLRSIIAVPLYMTLIAAKRLNDETALIAIIRASGSDATSDKDQDIDRRAVMMTCPTHQLEDFLEFLSARGCIRSDLSSCYDFRNTEDLFKHRRQEPVDLDTGFFSTVFPAVRRSSQLSKFGLAAIKVKFATTQYFQIKHELLMLCSVQGNPSIIGFHGTFKSNHPVAGEMYHLATDWYELDVSWLVSERHKVPEYRATEIISDVIQALHHLDSCGICHRDVKPQNIRLTDTWKAVLVEFGSAAYVVDDARLAEVVGSPGYMPPETLLGRCAGIPGDVFAAGIVLFFMLAGQTPFGEPEAASLRLMEMDDELDCSLIAFCSATCQSLVKQMTRRRSQARLTPKELFASHIVTAAAVSNARPLPSSLW